MTSRGLVMVIDGDPRARERIVEHLTRLGYEPRGAADDAQASLALSGEEWPAVVIRDAAAVAAGDTAFFRWTQAGPRKAPALLTMVKPFMLVDFGDKLLRTMRLHAAA